MFNKKNNITIEKPIVGEKEDKEILKFFEKQKDFLGWDNFETLWDIGMGNDLVAQSNREEKWFLFNEPKTKVVKRPSDFWEKEALRLNISTHALFLQESQKRGIKMNDFFKIFFNN